jgi:hypothetical protein
MLAALPIQRPFPSSGPPSSGWARSIRPSRSTSHSCSVWSPYWERYFRYELVPVAGGVRARSDRGAVLEDATYGEEHDPLVLWRYLAMPVLLLRATQQLVEGAGFIVPPKERDAFLAQVASASLVEIDANHYGINTHPAASEAIAAYLG